MSKLFWIIGSAVLVIAVVAGTVLITFQNTNSKPAPKSTASTTSTSTTLGLPNNNNYAKDYLAGEPWENAEGQDGTISYSQSSFVALKDNGQAWAYVFNSDDSMPPGMSTTLYLGKGYTKKDFATGDLQSMDRTSDGYTYMLVRGWINAPSGKSWNDLTFTPTNRTVDRLRKQPWAGYILQNFGVNLNDPWWNGKDLNKNYTVTCNGTRVNATLALTPYHEWNINKTVVPEDTLLQNNCTIGN